MTMPDLDRRAFLRAGTNKLTNAAMQHAESRARQRATRWIRPPFAIDELAFLTSCTRCGDCIDACPHQVLFPLPATLGVAVTNTPAIDIIHKGCHLCEDWPCVTVCDSDALTRPNNNTDAESPVPQIASVRVNPRTCLPYSGPECGACSSSCPVPGAMVWDGNKPRIDAERCVGCGLCREACIVDPKAIEISSLYKAK